MCERLTHLWSLKAPDGSDSLTTAAIGQLLGVSKEAVTGKVRRMGLPSRTSPIRAGLPRQHPPSRRPPTQAGRPLPAGACTLPPLPSELEDA